MVQIPPWLRLSSLDRDNEEQSASLLLVDGDHEKNNAGTKRNCHYFLGSLPTYPTAAFGAMLQILRPSLPDSRNPLELHPTSYLDGLRGCASFVVMLYHIQERFYHGIRPGFGSSAEATNPLSLPVVRLFFYGGGSMVAIFFVISGYVLSTKPLKLARHGDADALYRCVASSTIRRAPRLYIPPLGVTLMMTFAAQAGLLDPRYYGPAPNGLISALTEWLKATSRFISPFADREYAIEGAVWTIPHEFKGSLLVYLTCLGLGKSSSRFRLTFLICMAAFWLYHGEWDLFLFSGGMLCADIHLLYPPPSGPTNLDISPGTGTSTATSITPDSPDRGQQTRLSKLLHALTALLALYLLSIPEPNEGATDTPGYITLTATLTPPSYHGRDGPRRFWPAIGAVLLVATLDHAGPTSLLQRVFVTPFAQYLGDLSFSLYLCHGAVMHTLGNLLIPWGCEQLGIDYGAGVEGRGGWWYILVLLVSFAVGLRVVFWVAGVLTEVLDKGSVRVSRMVATW